jgi:Flp pilus assembly protein TadG
MRFNHRLRHVTRNVDRRDRRNLRERGAAALEFALIAPFFFFVVFGGIEIGLMFRSHLALEDMSRSAARVASVERASVNADGQILQRISDRSAALNGDVEKVIIYSAETLDAPLPTECETVSASVANKCNVYIVTGGDVQAIVDAAVWETGLTAAERGQWKNLGIYIEYDYEYVTGFFDSITLSTTSVEVVELDL